MAILDQCKNCKKNGSEECKQDIVFNGLSCDRYQKRFDLTKSSDRRSQSSDIPKPVQQPTPELQSPHPSGVGCEPEESLLKSLFSFNGRNRRSKYWITQLCVGSLFVPANIMGDDMSEGVAIFTLLMLIPAIWMMVVNIVRRCHDLGKSGFWCLLTFIPLVNLFIGIYLAFFKGEMHDNEYGTSPY